MVIAARRAAPAKKLAPAGNFAARRFSVMRASDIKTTCNDGHGFRQATGNMAL
jgi:hypothetical protein